MLPEWLLLAAAAQGNKPAKAEELRFLKAVGAILTAGNACLITLDVAMYASKKAGVGAAVLAAMAKIAELQPCSAPSMAQDQPLPAAPSGASASCAWLIGTWECSLVGV